MGGIFSKICCWTNMANNTDDTQPRIQQPVEEDADVRVVTNQCGTIDKSTEKQARRNTKQMMNSVDRGYDSTSTPSSDSSGYDSTSTPSSDSSGYDSTSTPTSDSSGYDCTSTSSSDTSGYDCTSTPSSDSSDSDSTSTPSSDSSDSDSTSTPSSDSSDSDSTSTSGSKSVINITLAADSMIHIVNGNNTTINDERINAINRMIKPMYQMIKEVFKNRNTARITVKKNQQMEMKIHTLQHKLEASERESIQRWQRLETLLIQTVEKLTQLESLLNKVVNRKTHIAPINVQQEAILNKMVDRDIESFVSSSAH